VESDTGAEDNKPRHFFVVVVVVVARDHCAPKVRRAHSVIVSDRSVHPTRPIVYRGRAPLRVFVHYFDVGDPGRLTNGARRGPCLLLPVASRKTRKPAPKKKIVIIIIIVVVVIRPLGTSVKVIRADGGGHTRRLIPMAKFHCDDNNDSSLKVRVVVVVPRHQFYNANNIYITCVCVYVQVPC